MVGKIGLRGRKKETQKRVILAAAKSLFSANGFEGTTVQSIADKAMVSAPTVYTYFGSKPALVLAIIIEADAVLGAQADVVVERSGGNPVEDMKALLTLIIRESLKTIDAQTWRNVFAMSVLDSENEVGKGYKIQNARLYDKCEDLLAKCTSMGTLPKTLDLKLLRDMCECVNHALFQQLVSGKIKNVEEYENRLQKYLEVIL